MQTKAYIVQPNYLVALGLVPPIAEVTLTKSQKIELLYQHVRVEPNNAKALNTRARELGCKMRFKGSQRNGFSHNVTEDQWYEEAFTTLHDCLEDAIMSSPDGKL
jgi:hypothetical protein